ncbi:MAG: dephospho-CoA kinase [Acidobacteriota bacterium]|nr:dephospho-CoA kinase [Acidobacteriota bacterium]
MLRVALTGGIGTGKTHVLGRLAEAGVPVVDADRIVHALMEPGGAVTQAVAARFGTGMLDADGRVDRKRLGALVFADEGARRDLETIVHPAVYDAIARWLSEMAQAGHPLAIADIPLLYETGRAAAFDRVIVAACPPEVQVVRVMQRDGIGEAAARQRLAAQLPIDEKTARADFVIRTDGTFAETDRQVEETLAQLRALAGS